MNTCLCRPGTITSFPDAAIAIWDILQHKASNGERRGTTGSRWDPLVTAGRGGFPNQRLSGLKKNHDIDLHISVHSSLPLHRIWGLIPPGCLNIRALVPSSSLQSQPADCLKDGSDVGHKDKYGIRGENAGRSCEVLFDFLRATLGKISL